MATITLATLKTLWQNVSDTVATAGSAILTKGIQIAGSDGTNARILKTNTSGELLTSLSGSTPATAILQNAVSSTGAGTDFTVDGYGVATLQITGSFAATITFFGSVDGTNFIEIPAYNSFKSTLSTTATTIGIYEINCKGLQKIRAFVAWSSGTSITIVGRAELFAGSQGGIETLGRIITTSTNKAVTLNTDILTDYTSAKTMQTTLMVETNTGGVLSLEVDGILASLNGGVALEAGKWYAFDVPMLAASVYNLQLSASATMQIKWIGGF